MGYDYQIQYRSGAHNQAADAFSRCFDQDPSSLMSLSVPCPFFFEELRRQLEDHHEYRHFRQAITVDPDKHSGFTLVHNLILWKGRIWLPKDLAEYHTTPTGGHKGIAKMIARLTENFEWSGLREDVTKFVSRCLNCQRAKYDTKRAAGLLCPLPVPH